MTDIELLEWFNNNRKKITFDGGFNVLILWHNGKNIEFKDKTLQEQITSAKLYQEENK